MLFCRKPPDVSHIKPTVHIEYFFKYSYLLNRNSKFNMLYMEFDWKKYIESEYDVILPINHLKKYYLGCNPKVHYPRFFHIGTDPDCG